MSIVPKVVYPIHDYPSYEPRDALVITSKAVIPSFGIGLTYATAMERFRHFRAPLIPSLIRVGKESFFLGSVGCAYQFVEVAASNVREREDGWNNFCGGLAAGALIGVRAGTVTNTVFTSLLFGSILGLSRWAGGMFGSFSKEVEVDHSKSDGPQSDFWMVRDRVPLSETISKVGEGRGVFYSNGKPAVPSSEEA
ncbi:hypothetical protein POJ06DRAFT_248661 [Lipomyces tetrasporus]|uniref:NADH-ubiquinone oxidoreductase subunit B14.7 n=1 Tax=Lipomyces tetrasporus TaxID=54092 RepID=A0AAD7QV47_9ASCO|nr:uncharacterized protein POJ06DRAFT_248661 [Lipomyces tetrasporus]KAJ8102057.1 hypothetical protein POJ06DRAFT_248661 [Lipomyces tetrasporus]